MVEDLYFHQRMYYMNLSKQYHPNHRDNLERMVEDLYFLQRKCCMNLSKQCHPNHHDNLVCKVEDLYFLRHKCCMNLRMQFHPSHHDNLVCKVVVLYFHQHEHPEPTDTNKITSATILPAGCDGEIYYYRIRLTAVSYTHLTLPTKLEV